MEAIQIKIKQELSGDNHSPDSRVPAITKSNKSVTFVDRKSPQLEKLQDSPVTIPLPNKLSVLGKTNSTPENSKDNPRFSEI